jgi:hypothetical protein
MENKHSVSISRLIAIPALITLAVTILRLVGELEHWPSPLFNTQPGGGGAIIGISWLPIIFGPYFALKLAGAGDGPASNAKAIGFAVGSLFVLVAGGILFGLSINHPNFVTALGLLLMLGAAFVPGLGWRSLGNTLVAYAYAARIPVLIVMYFAMTGNGGAGWGTHYDAVPPSLVHAPPLQKFFFAGVLPQMMLWIGFTTAVGSILGTIVTAVAYRKKQVAAAAV